ncbi:16S rRNA (guanine(966)-N(2))-methyltransferase RsmD [Solicola gregarius]|uniref:16S rRNA (Guanine(966)-N(2))-methyltransferase RsmD n=1 Tax=Solicola gregarius TaxID=2908642 RepID=A0AA46TI55_9ACTN|nr:16S rRNA (guanine(966)-N(2))-methyltransferase RsmD [Solicola gregarius]UYM05695.1 16S rRNA (guanine(966)-N(2))-methyltransferase RsmD [Solicola gregarius]
MTRIIAGTAGGRRIATPPGDATRPTTDRVREALFSSLESQLGGWDDVRFLDLFAGSGANGLEALSRGAAHATFVESDRRTAGVIRRNVETLGFSGADVTSAAAASAIARLAPAYDVVFLDPPYDYADESLAALLTALADGGLFAPDAVVVVERGARSREPAWPEGVESMRSKKYGSTTLWYGLGA